MSLGSDTAAIEIEVPATHLYPGLIAALPATMPSPAIGAPPSLRCILAFNDGSMSFGDLSRREGDGWVLAVNAYMTARKTQVAARRWLVSVANPPADRLSDDCLPDDRLSLRIVRKLA